MFKNDRFFIIKSSGLLIISTYIILICLSALLLQSCNSNKPSANQSEQRTPQNPWEADNDSSLLEKPYLFKSDIYKYIWSEPCKDRGLFALGVCWTFTHLDDKGEIFLQRWDEQNNLIYKNIFDISGVPKEIIKNYVIAERETINGNDYSVSGKYIRSEFGKYDNHLEITKLLNPFMLDDCLYSSDNCYWLLPTHGLLVTDYPKSPKYLQAEFSLKSTFSKDISWYGMGWITFCNTKHTLPFTQEAIEKACLKDNWESAPSNVHEVSAWIQSLNKEQNPYNLKIDNSNGASWETDTAIVEVVFSDDIATDRSSQRERKVDRIKFTLKATK